MKLSNRTLAAAVALLFSSVWSFGGAVPAAVGQRPPPDHIHEHHHWWFICFCAGDCENGEVCCPVPEGEH